MLQFQIVSEHPNYMQEADATEHRLYKIYKIVYVYITYKINIYVMNI